MLRFKDKTGRPGPSTWETGNSPEGQGRLSGDASITSRMPWRTSTPNRERLHKTAGCTLPTRRRNSASRLQNSRCRKFALVGPLADASFECVDIFPTALFARMQVDEVNPKVLSNLHFDSLTCTTITLTLSSPPCEFARETRRSAVLCASAASRRTLVISVSVTIRVSPSLQSNTAS